MKIGINIRFIYINIKLFLLIFFFFGWSQILIIDLLIPAIKDIVVDVNIHNIKLIYIKYQHEKFGDPSGSCLKRGIIFSGDETELTLELPNK